MEANRINMKKFTKRKENFICENCGHFVVGNGFTNHCPNCFFSKHVDINPGDRLCNCNGLMKPIEILQKDGNFIILHKCITCGFERRNRISEKDNTKNLIELIKKINLTNSQYLP